MQCNEFTRNFDITSSKSQQIQTIWSENHWKKNASIDFRKRLDRFEFVKCENHDDNDFSSHFDEIQTTMLKSNQTKNKSIFRMNFTKQIFRVRMNFKSKEQWKKFRVRMISFLFSITHQTWSSMNIIILIMREFSNLIHAMIEQKHIHEFDVKQWRRFSISEFVHC